MPPRDEPPLHNETTDDEALGSDTESLPDLAPADDLTPDQENDYLAPAHGDSLEDNSTDNHTAVPDNGPAPLPWGHIANSALFAAFLANDSQHPQTEEGPSAHDTAEDPPS